MSGLGFGLMNAAFSLMNVLSDHIGPGTVGLKGDSTYFLLVSSLTALAFLLLNVAWSVLMSESVEKADKKLALIVLITHLIATTIVSSRNRNDKMKMSNFLTFNIEQTFLNRSHLQLISLIVVYSLTTLCGLGAFQIAGVSPNRLISIRSSSDV